MIVEKVENMSDIYTMGIDIGSTSSKCVVLKNGKDLVSSGVVNLGAGTKGADQVIEKVLADCGIKFEDLNVIVST
ncbi:MAG: hypothetical protein E7G73_05155, partial [Peptostreptococcus sp.]|nr:hypothetical protein [Peptostreptococcus sp.]